MSNPLRFCNTTSDSDLIDFSNALIDCSILAESSSTAVLNVLNALFCCTDATPVPTPAPPMITRVAIVNAVKGSRFDDVLREFVSHRRRQSLRHGKRFLGL